MGTEVAIQHLRGVPADKQTEVCIAFALEQGWPVRAIFPAGSADEAVNLVDQGLIDLVLLPFVDREALEIEERVVAAGGRVAYCRQTHERHDLGADTSDVIAYLHRKGRTDVNEVARFLRVSADRVRRVFSRRP